jgi:hypothetical protein
MLISDLSLLQCVDCFGSLKIIHVQENQNIILNALVECTDCKRNYPILNGVGIFFKKHVYGSYLTKEEEAQIKKLKYQKALEGITGVTNSNDVNQLNGTQFYQQIFEEFVQYTNEDFGKSDYQGKEMFQKFIPMDFNSFNDKEIFIGCGGGGREVFHILNHNPKKIIVVEINSIIHTYPKLFPSSGDKLISLRSDLCFHPVKKNIVDISICDHALQHVAQNKLGFKQLVDVTKKGGNIAICVYSYENNFIMTHIVENLKVILKKIPNSLFWKLSFFTALFNYFLINAFYIPLNKFFPSFSKFIPLSKHMLFWAKFSLKMIRVAHFDLLIAPISYHFKKDEMEDFVKENSLGKLKLINTHSTTWSLVCKK